MLLEILTICSLTAIAPFYDCSESWEIRIYDNFPAVQCNNVDEELVSLGCSHLGRNVVHIVDMPDYRDKFGLSILQHELRHLQCKCNFH